MEGMSMRSSCCEMAYERGWAEAFDSHEFSAEVEREVSEILQETAEEEARERCFEFAERYRSGANEGR